MYIVQLRACTFAAYVFVVVATVWLWLQGFCDSVFPCWFLWLSDMVLTGKVLHWISLTVNQVHSSHAYTKLVDAWLK